MPPLGKVLIILGSIIVIFLFSASSFPTVDSFGFQNSLSSSNGGHLPSLVTTISVGDQPTNMAFDPFNSYMYVTNLGSGTISVINPIKNRVVLTINDYGAGPGNIAYDPLTKDMYVTNNFANDVAVIDSQTNAIIRTITVGSRPTSIVYDKDDQRLYVSNFGSDSVTVISANSNLLIKTIAVSGEAQALAYDASDQLVYVALYNRNEVALINANDKVIGEISVGDTPAGMAYDPHTNYVYVSDFLLK
jgi:YVTN family beta-propeller protein